MISYEELQNKVIELYEENRKLRKELQGDDENVK